MELNDVENGVTLKCRSTDGSIVAGYGTVNTIRADIVTEYVYLSNKRFDFRYPFEIEAYYSELE